ncbi:hypothetical protein KKF84_13370, partial [Myxococcota bacterium]|nr:hypothetical protein [Myxococcota bacterium]
MKLSKSTLKKSPAYPLYRNLALLAVGTSLTAAMALSCTKKESTETGAKKGDVKPKPKPQVDGGMPQPQHTIIKADKDGDGVPDASDRCPAVKGSPDNYGCPKDTPMLGGVVRPPTP